MHASFPFAPLTFAGRALVVLALISTALATAPVVAQERGATRAPASPPEVGAPAPKLDLEELLQAPDGSEATWNSLRGKVVVLEFWATWCRPCIAAIPHLNEIIDDLADRDDVVVIAITDEPRSTIEPFLKKRSMKSWIGLDTDRSVLERYGVRGIPQTVVVDADGRIAAITYPLTLESSMLEDLAEGKEVTFPGGPVNLGRGPDDGAPLVINDDGEFLRQILPQSLGATYAEMLEHNPITPGHERLGLFRGAWNVDETAYLMGEDGPDFSKLSGTGRVTFECVDERYVVMRKTIDGNPAHREDAMIGFDSKNDTYFMHEFSGVHSSPVIWTGAFDDASRTLTLTRGMDIQISGMVDPAGDGDGLMAQATMKRVITFDDADSFTDSLSMDFGPPDGDGGKVVRSPGGLVSRTVGHRNN